MHVVPDCGKGIRKDLKIEKAANGWLSLLLEGPFVCLQSSLSCESMIDYWFRI